MRSRAADIRDITLLTIAVVIAAVLIPGLPVLGTPLAAFALAMLAFRFGDLWSWAAVLMATVVLGLLSPEFLIVAPVLAAAGPFAARGLQRRSAFAVAIFVSAVVLCVSLAGVAIAAAVSHLSLIAYVQTELTASLDALLKGMVAGGASLGKTEVAQLRMQVLLLLPGWLVLMAAASGCLATVAAIRAGKRAGVTVRQFPGITQLEISGYALVPVIAGVFALAAARLIPGIAGLALGAVGGNLLIVSVPLLSLQGLGIVVFWLNRLEVPKWGRILLVAGALVCEPVVPLMTLAGLADTWLNLRQLPRDGHDGSPETR
jgi:uncharacterized protein YybS (DUF2232 family)